MSEKNMPWMVDGKPGQIIGLMSKCMAEVASVQASKDQPSKATGKDGREYTKPGGKSTKAQDIINVVRDVLVANGVVMRVMGSDAQFGGGKYVSMQVTVHFAAPDGSYWPCSAPSGALAPNMKSSAAALTAGVKSILRHTFMLHIVEREEDMREAFTMSDGLRAWHDRLLDCSSQEELQAAANDPIRKSLADHELPEARNMFRDRQEDIREAAAQDKLAYWKAREMEGKEKPESAKPRRAR